MIADAIEAHARACEEARARWGDGPWNSEPHREEWRSAHGLHALALRVPWSGHWCGYVGVPPGHPWHGRDIDEIDACAPGGITYSRGCEGAVCHAPPAGEPDALWWVGFDCAHADDLTPYDAALHGNWRAGVYRDLAWVRGEVESLAAEAARVHPPG